MPPRMFMAGCPNCQKAFIVEWELRYAGRQLICPFCATRFLPDAAAYLDERHR